MFFVKNVEEKCLIGVCLIGPMINLSVRSVEERSEREMTNGRQKGAFGHASNVSVYSDTHVINP